VKHIDPEALASRLIDQFRLPESVPAVRRLGRLLDVTPGMLKASLPNVGLGELCIVEPDGLEAEVVAVRQHIALLSPFGEPVGMRAGQRVRALGRSHSVRVGSHLIGTVIDGFGRPLGPATRPSSDARVCSLEGSAPDPLKRAIIDTPMFVNVKAIDAALTIGRGQRIGIFAAAGVGKSTLLSMMCDGCGADVVVLALVGERGREVREFLEHSLTPAARARSVVVVATSDRPSIERLKAAYTATTIAEFFRDQGKDVLLLVDSLTRFARAGREIGSAAGEPNVTGSFPASVFTRLAPLLERAGRAEYGSITGVYTVLVEGDNLNEPLADEVRSILDGHIVLSRKLAAANRFPAVDVCGSVSRVMPLITDEAHRALAGRLRMLLSKYDEIELLVRVGEYQVGNDKDADDALQRHGEIVAFLNQGFTERVDIDGTLKMLRRAVRA
jgi:type III secretion protein N (ATPase)